MILALIEHYSLHMITGAIALTVIVMTVTGLTDGFAAADWPSKRRILKRGGLLSAFVATVVMLFVGGNLLSSPSDSRLRHAAQHSLASHDNAQAAIEIMRGRGVDIRHGARAWQVPTDAEINARVSAIVDANQQSFEPATPQQECTLLHLLVGPSNVSTSDAGECKLAHQGQGTRHCV